MQLKNYILFVAASAMAVFAQSPDPAINTPSSVEECLPVQLTFSGSAPPFIITVVPVGQAGAAPLVTVGTTSADAITWNANLPAGQYTLVIRDSLGRTNPSGPFTINTNTDTSCLSASAAPASTAAGSASGSVAATTPVVVTTTAANTPVTTPAGTTSAAGVSSQSVSSTSHSASSAASASAAATTSKAPSGANALQQPLGLAGLVGLVGVGAAALL